MAIDTLGANALASDSVTTAKIVNDAVTAAKIPAGAVVADIADGGITTAKLADDAITGAKLANDIAISTTGNIATTGSGTITSAGLITASGNIAIGGTGAANTLDDYEEGQFTPAKNNGGSVSYTQQNGYYIKVGRLVTVYMDIVIDSASSESGSAQITMPFTSQTTSPAKPAYMAFVPWICDVNFTSSTRKAAGFINEGVSYMFMYRYNQENSSGYAYANGNVTGRWSGVIQYYTA